jgi:hypothetical protein
MKFLATAAFIFGFGIASAQAMPAAPLQGSTGSLTQVGWRCGPGWHINPWGRCVPNRRFYGAWGYYGPGWHHRYWHGHWHRHWHRW